MKTASIAITALALFFADAAYKDSVVIAGERVLRGIPSKEDITRGLKPGLPSATTSHETKGTSDKPPALSLLILFEFDSSSLTPAAKRQLEPLADALNSNELRQYSFIVEGHTDAAGSASYNQSLSERRAEAVYGYLASVHGIDRSRIVTVGKGERELYDPANPDADINRRVKIINSGTRQ